MFEFFKLSREESFKSTKIMFYQIDTQMHVKYMENHSKNMKNKIS